jgi:hypothetical protein
MWLKRAHILKRFWFIKGDQIIQRKAQQKKNNWKVNSFIYGCARTQNTLNKQPWGKHRVTTDTVLKVSIPWILIQLNILLNQLNAHSTYSRTVD